MPRVPGHEGYCTVAMTGTYSTTHPPTYWHRHHWTTRLSELSSPHLASAQRMHAETSLLPTRVGILRHDRAQVGLRGKRRTRP